MATQPKIFLLRIKGVEEMQGNKLLCLRHLDKRILAMSVIIHKPLEAVLVDLLITTCRLLYQEGVYSTTTTRAYKTFPVKGIQVEKKGKMGLSSSLNNSSDYL